ncbi:hypothetical protein PM082_021963 [Marasmius tenuissimus]|nr:hypothetical protein PM082_021963 [Marasmius tenuissimus]
MTIVNRFGHERVPYRQKELQGQTNRWFVHSPSAGSPKLGLWVSKRSPSPDFATTVAGHCPFFDSLLGS